MARQAFVRHSGGLIHASTAESTSPSVVAKDTRMTTLRTLGYGSTARPSLRRERAYREEVSAKQRSPGARKGRTAFSGCDAAPPAPLSPPAPLAKGRTRPRCTAHKSRCLRRHGPCESTTPQTTQREASSTREARPPREKNVCLRTAPLRLNQASAHWVCTWLRPPLQRQLRETSGKASSAPSKQIRHRASTPDSSSGATAAPLAPSRAGTGAETVTSTTVSGVAVDISGALTARARRRRAAAANWAETCGTRGAQPLLLHVAGRQAQGRAREVGGRERVAMATRQASARHRPRPKTKGDKIGEHNCARARVSLSGLPCGGRPRGRCRRCNTFKEQLPLHLGIWHGRQQTQVLPPALGGCTRWGLTANLVASHRRCAAQCVPGTASKPAGRHCRRPPRRR